jgi:hypothetical protein
MKRVHLGLFNSKMQLVSFSLASWICLWNTWSLFFLFCFFWWLMFLMRHTYISQLKYAFVYRFIKMKTERKVRIQEQKHAKREDNDRFRNYSCVCICMQRESPQWNEMYEVHSLEGDSRQRLSHHYHHWTDETKAVHLLLWLTK